MGSSLHLHMFLILCCCSLYVLTNSYSSTQPLCHEDERSALLQFKHSFVINESASVDPFAYPKVESWKLDGNNSNCCSWDGVECDRHTGLVIGLDLSSSFLYGSINSNSSLFSLVHLQRLNLADNHFNYSRIPTRIVNLSRLRSLNLHNSILSGQIPSEISSLSQLIFLDLSGYFDTYPTKYLLTLEKPSLGDLVQNLTHLKVLDLNWVKISSIVPGALLNMTSLTTLSLRSCLLYGEFPMGIFRLPNLRLLGLSGNENLFGSLPEFPRGSLLEELLIARTSFSGLLPTSIGNLAQLTDLVVAQNNMWGQIPSSIANLSKLTSLGLGGGTFDAGTLPFLLGKLSKLTILDLAGMKFSDHVFPQSLSNLTQLSVLALNNNELLGEIPSWLLNLTQLTDLRLFENHLYGTFPSFISQLKHLNFLDLSSNSLSGKVELDIFQNHKNLKILDLSKNKLTVLATKNTNVTLPKFIGIGLGSCNLKVFPDFLGFQDKLEFLGLADNRIHGEVPTWLWYTSKETLKYIELQGNFLTGFEQHPDAIPWITLLYLDFRFNRLQGPLPLPPSSILSYTVAGNLLTGEIPPSFCQNTALFALDVSHNYLSGAIPRCLSSASDSMLLLNLSSNNFEGPIPQMFTKGIKMIDLSQNQLHGGVPRSLANCRMLEILVLGDNQIMDTFPFWLGALPELQVLVLRSNKFHGAIENPKTKLRFPKLRIIDLSHNGFSGTLPSEYFQNWNAMKVVSKGNSKYMQVASGPRSFGDGDLSYLKYYTYSVTIFSKGTKRFYEKIKSVFVAVDLSNNIFSGKIPESLGSLCGLQLLNISKNNLTGVIPSSFANLMNLESLDMSQNLLSGEIPQQLTQLTFLSVVNLSHNRLTGPVPYGKQFDTFDNSSYGGNMGLCGVPLTMLCRNSGTSTLPLAHQSQGNDSEFSIGSYWMFIILGYGSGLIVGLVIGHTLTTRYHERFVAIFERGKKTRKMQKRKGRRN